MYISSCFEEQNHLESKFNAALSKLGAWVIYVKRLVNPWGWGENWVCRGRYWALEQTRCRYVILCTKSTGYYLFCCFSNLVGKVLVAVNKEINNNCNIIIQKNIWKNLLDTSDSMASCLSSQNFKMSCLMRFPQRSGIIPMDVSFSDKSWSRFLI